MCCVVVNLEEIGEVGAILTYSSRVASVPVHNKSRKMSLVIPGYVICDRGMLKEKLHLDLVSACVFGVVSESFPVVKFHLLQGLLHTLDSLPKRQVNVSLSSHGYTKKRIHGTETWGRKFEDYVHL